MSLPPIQDPAAAHAEHDPLLIARLVADDLEPAERSGAERLAATCTACRLLCDDLRSVHRSLGRDLPTPRRQRDYRLTPGSVAASRAPRPVLAWLGRLLGSPGRLASPLAGTALVLGIALVLASGAGLLGPGQGAEMVMNVGSSGTDQAAPSAGGGLVVSSAPQAASSASAAPGEGSPAAQPSAGLGAKVVQPPASASPTAEIAASRPSSPVPDASPGPAGSLALVGWLLIVVGLTVLVRRWLIGRRARVA